MGRYTAQSSNLILKTAKTQRPQTSDLKPHSGTLQLRPSSVDHVIQITTVKQSSHEESLIKSALPSLIPTSVEVFVLPESNWTCPAVTYFILVSDFQ
jgi:ribosomal protein L11